MESADRLPSLAGLTMCSGRLNTDRALRSVTEPCVVSTLLPPLPDLALSNLTGPVSVKAGSSVSVNIQLENLGGTAAPWAFTMFALSSNPILNWDNNPQGYSWLGYHYVQPFAPGNANISVVFNVPNATTPGTYYLQGVVDYGNAVREFNENNNTSNIIQIQVLAP